MRRIVGLLPGRQVALRISTIGRSNLQRVVAIDVALAALHRCVFIRQRETRGAVIELAISPGRDRMAGSAGGSCRRKAASDVIRNIAAKCSCALPGGLVAAQTIGRIERVIVVDMAGRARCRSRRHVRAC